MNTMDMYGFYCGEIFNAHKYLGAHITANNAVFRVFAPNADSVGIIGDFNNWTETSMTPIYDGNFYECSINDIKEGMFYKVRVHEKSGRCIDHSDPYGFETELRPHNASILYNRYNYQFQDKKWMSTRTDGMDKAVNIYEVHLGSWKTNPENENGWYGYEDLSEQLVQYVKENGYNYIEIMPICEYPCDESWGYQALGFFSPTSRYGNADGLKHFIDLCHQNEVGVILDFAPVHFAVNDYGLSNFDGAPLYEYTHTDIAYNQWGSKNFAHSRGEVRSFLQSAMCYWLEDFHFDGVRMDAISNMIYWQGNVDRGVNKSAVSFIQYMNEHLKKLFPSVMLIAEDSTSYPNVTSPVSAGGLGFDYKWDMGWMNDTLEYFKENTADRVRDYHKLTFSMHYFYSEKFLMPLSHDEVVHGKATILQKMNGDYDIKFPQARAFYMYMYAHPGKKLNFMGNEIGQLREWDEKREQDWGLLEYPKHAAFHNFMSELNNIYMKHNSFFENDFNTEGFEWIDCTGKTECVYTFLRKSKTEKILVLLNFSHTICGNYTAEIDNTNQADLLFDSEWECFGGLTSKSTETVKSDNGKMVFELKPFSAKYYIIK